MIKIPFFYKKGSAIGPVNMIVQQEISKKLDINKIKLFFGAESQSINAKHQNAKKFELKVSMTILKKKCCFLILSMLPMKKGSIV